MLAAGPVPEGLVGFGAPAAASPPAAAASCTPGLAVGLVPGAALAPGDEGPIFTLLLMKPIGLLNIEDMFVRRPLDVGSDRIGSERRAALQAVHRELRMCGLRDEKESE